MDIVITILYAFILMSVVLYVWHKLLGRKIKFKDYRLYITLIGMMFTSTINFSETNAIFRITLITLILIMFFKFLFKENINKTIVTPIYSQILIFILEFLYSISVLLIYNGDPNKIISIVLNNSLLTNVIISILLIIVVNIKITKKLYGLILRATDKISSIQLGLFCVIGMLIVNMALYGTYTEVNIPYVLVCNVGITILVLLIMFYSFRTQNKYNKVSDKYNVAIKSLKDYETMMTKYRIANHENKNLLLTVRAMILNKEKDIPKYIDSIIEQKYMDDEKLLFDVSSIPSGGLRATIYSEILKIKENNIDYLLNIDRQIRTVDLIELDTDTVIDICKIIGVFIDNAIEAVKGLKKKNINIDLYLDNKNLCIKVSNNYKGNINVSKINDEGYTTKGKGHGYGLPLVKSIISNNSIFENVTEVSKTIFSQVLIIKYKKVS